VCGYSPRLRLDLTVNILTNLAVNKRAITIFGGLISATLLDAFLTPILFLRFGAKPLARLLDGGRASFLRAMRSERFTTRAIPTQ